MNIRLDDQTTLATHHLDPGYQCLGDLRWVSIQQLVGLFYVGRKTAKQIIARNRNVAPYPNT